MQTDATLLANNTQHCWAQHVASVCMESQHDNDKAAVIALSDILEVFMVFKQELCHVRDVSVFEKKGLRTRIVHTIENI